MWERKESGMVYAQSTVIDRGAGFCPERLMRFLFVSSILGVEVTRVEGLYGKTKKKNE